MKRRHGIVDREWYRTLAAKLHRRPYNELVTRRALAVKLGVAHNTVINWEERGMRPTDLSQKPVFYRIGDVRRYLLSQSKRRSLLRQSEEA